MGYSEAFYLIFTGKVLNVIFIGGYFLLSPFIGVIMGILNKLFGKKQPEAIPKLGRNDLCWCGSGKKYKKCHLESDMKKHSSFLASTCTSRS